MGTGRPERSARRKRIPIEDLRLLERLAREEMGGLDLKDARAALKEAEQKGTTPLRELMREAED